MYHNYVSGILNPLFVQLMHTNYYKIVKQLKSFTIILAAPTCFGLHKPSSGSSQPDFAKVTMLTSVKYHYLKLSVLWLYMQPQYRYTQLTYLEVCIIALSFLFFFFFFQKC